LKKQLNINLFYSIFITLIAYILLYVAARLLSSSMLLDIKLINIILMVSVANILSFIPITISGLGTREAVFIYFFHELSYTTEQALLFSTLFFVCFYIIGGLYGYICFMIKPVSIKNIKKEIQ